jgi:hypothetical protein
MRKALYFLCKEGIVAMHSVKFDVKRWKWYLALPVLVVAIIAMTFVVWDGQSSKAAPAQAQTVTNRCINALGKLEKSIPIKDGKTMLGSLDIYYNKSTGYKCAVTISVGSSEGKAKGMMTEIAACTQTKPTNAYCGGTSNAVVDKGPDRKYEAGPVGVKAKGHCISATGTITWKGKTHTVTLTPYVAQCE